MNLHRPQVQVLNIGQNPRQLQFLLLALKPILNILEHQPLAQLLDQKQKSGPSQGKPSGEGPRVSGEQSIPKTEASLGTETGENFNVGSQVIEIEGKKYVVFNAIKQTLSADGTIIKEEIRIEAIEILPDMEMKVFQNPERVKIENEKLAGQNVKVTITVEEIGGLNGLNPEVRERIDEGLRSAFKARTESNTNEYNVKGNNGGVGDRSHGETVPLSIPMVNNDGGEMGQPFNRMPMDLNIEQKAQNVQDLGGGGGMIGCGLLSVEDGQQMKDFLMGTVWPKTKEIGSEILNNPQVQGGFDVVDGVGEMIVGAGIAIATAETGIGIYAGALIALHGADRTSNGWLKMLTSEERNSLTSQIISKFGASPEFARSVDDGITIVTTLGGTFILGKIGKEGAEIGVKLVGKEGQETPIFVKKEFCPKGPRDFTKPIEFDGKIGQGLKYKVDQFASIKNYEYYTKYRMGYEFDWSVEFNGWLKQVDINYVQKHHTLSNKGESATAIRKHAIFKEGLLDVKLLDSNRIIMPLPTKPGMHPTMNVHAGGRHTKEYTADMNRELEKIRMEFENQKITKDQIETTILEDSE